MLFGRRTVIVGGGLAGVEIADFLMEWDREVVLVTDRDAAAEGLGTMPILRKHYLEKLKERGIPILCGMELRRITRKAFLVRTRGGENQTIETNSIALIPEVRSNSQILENLRNRVRELHAVGDCALLAGILEAIRDGFRAGRQIEGHEQEARRTH